MATTTKWIAVSASANQMTTELNSLANGSSAIATTAYDNSTNLALYAAFVLSVTFGSAPTAGNTIALYLTPAVDNTTFADSITGASPLTSNDYFVGNFVLRAVTTAQVVAVHRAGSGGMIMIPPYKFKCYAINNSGVAFPASGSTIAMATYALQNG